MKTSAHLISILLCLASATAVAANDSTTLVFIVDEYFHLLEVVDAPATEGPQLISFVVVDDEGSPIAVVEIGSDDPVEVEEDSESAEAGNTGVSYGQSRRRPDLVTVKRPPGTPFPGLSTFKTGDVTDD